MGMSFFRSVYVEMPWGIAQLGRLHGARDRFFGDTVQCRFLLIDDESVLTLIIFDVPIDVHHSVGAFENVANLARNRDLYLLAWSVDFSHQGLQFGRPRRDLHNLDSCAHAIYDRLKRA